MNHTTYIQNLFYSFLQNVDILSEYIMFIKHYNTLDMSLEEIEKIVGEDYKEGLLYHAFYKNDIKEPYEPFMNGIRYYYQKFFSNKMTVEEFVEECNVYSLHKEVFISYLSEGKAKRSEMIIVSEFNYEKYRFIYSIINCFNYISQRKRILIVLDRFHFAASTTIDIIEEIINNSLLDNVKIMVIYNELQQPLSYVESKFERLINIADEKSILFEWDDKNNLKNDMFHTSFVPNRRFFANYIRKLNNLTIMLAVEDAKYYIGIINDRIAEERIQLDDSDKFEFYSIAGLCDMLYGDENNALLMADKLLSFYDSKKDLEADYRYNILCARVHMKLFQSDIVIKYAEKSKEIAKKLNNEELYFFADILLKGAYFGGWRDVFVTDYVHAESDYEFIDKLRRYDFKNTLAHYLVYAFDNDYESIKSFAEGMPSKEYIEAIAIGKELDNNYFLHTAYTKYIAKFTNYGFHKNVDDFYKEKMEIIDKDGTSARRAFLHLGIGYNCIVNEKYIKANENFIKGIELLYEQKRVEALIEAMYNMSINSICAEDYMSACDYLNAMFKMLDNMDLLTIQMCNASKLYGLYALSFYKLGNEYRCSRCLKKMESLLSHIICDSEENNLVTNEWNEDLFLYNLLSAVLYKKNEDYDNAGEYFNKAKEFFEVSSSILFYASSVFITEYYEYFELIGNMDAANEILEYGIKYCKENGYNNKSKSIIYQIEKKNVNLRPIVAGFTNVTTDDLIELSRNVGIENRLEKRRKDIRFLSVWQEMLNKEYLEYDELIDKAIATLQNNFNFNGIMILEVKENCISELYKDIYLYPEYSYEDIKDFFVAVKREIITNRADKSYDEYDKILSMFSKNEILTFVGVPVFSEKGIVGIFIGIINMGSNKRFGRSVMSEEELVVIKTAVIQLYSSIERIRNRKNIIEINKKLNEVAITDMLTGLYNRQGLARMMESNARRKNKVTILYADLDNFKYYNDTFGHDLGDVILKEFSKVFKEVSKDIGYVVRYGGDEFLVVLENIDLQEAKQVAEKIYEKISDGFIPVIESYLNEKVEIPKEKKVSCSIGIAKSEGGSFEHITKALKKADEALYYMKKTTKSNYILWEDMNGHEESN